jgi:metallo-beta-lactamase family protein
MKTRLTFLGAVGTVTGSKYLLEIADRKYLIDCGLFQGLKQLRQRNWSALPVNPADIDAVLLTHAHIDHSGYLPLLVKNGFRGPILATAPTCDLCNILLPDSGHLQERDADFANRHGFSKHKPAKPLYTQQDAEDALKQFEPRAFDSTFNVAPNVSVRFLHAGHILGAAIIELTIAGKKIIFSGDLGRPGSATMVDPAVIREADYVVVESTYGNRLHEKHDAEELIADVVNRTAKRGGTILIPAFAVGRAQSLLFHVDNLKRDGRIADLPVFLDSPMAIDASDIFCRYLKDHRLTAAQCYTSCGVAVYTRSVEESKALDANPMPKIIISASGMATGGRILHHLKRYASDERNTVLFTGFQAAGTRGAAMTAGVQSVKIHGEQIPVRAEVKNLHMLSAHADADEILSWLRNLERAPSMTFVTHGEPDASEALRKRITEELNWPCSTPLYEERVEL